MGMDYSQFSIEKIQESFSAMTVAEIQNAVCEMSPQQIAAVIKTINEQHDIDWKSKTKAIILGINSREQLESAGQSMSLSQILEIFSKDFSLPEDHFLPIIAKIPSPIFKESLIAMNDAQIEILKSKSSTEPIQHHLNIFFHEGSHVLNEFEKKITELSQSIEQIDLEIIGYKEFNTIIENINQIKASIEKLIDETNRALLIAWNTNRIDLIEKLNHLKDMCKRDLVFSIGKIDSNDPMSLFGKLTNKIHSVYGNPEDLEDSEALQDEDPSIEGIVKFSVLYLEDYWNIGLLPEISNPKKIEVSKSSSEKDLTTNKEKLFSLAQNNLEKIQLATVGDLKKNYIFNKKTLSEYIKENLIK